MTRNSRAVRHQPTARTVLSLWAGAVSAHLDPAWRAGRHPMIGLRPWLSWFAAVLLVPAGFLGYAAGQRGEDVGPVVGPAEHGQAG